MKRLFLLAFILSSALPCMAGIRIAVISDCHIVADEHISLLGNASGKMNAQSIDLLRAALDSVQADCPDLLLISGDLTYNGEKKGHLTMRDLLYKVSAAGTRVLVVPGNHDILNPHHLGDEGTTPDDFRAIYADFMGDMLHSGSLSWAQRIGDDMAIIGLDANIYGSGNYVSDGCITPSHLEWLAQTAQTMHSEGRMIIALVHQQLLEHFSNQASLLPNTLYNITYEHVNSNTRAVTAAEVRQAFADAGIHYVVSGHLHVHDIAGANFTRHGKPWRIWDISTGGLSTYPSYIRTLQVEPKTEAVSITSKTVNIDLPLTCPDGRSYGNTHDYGQSLLESQVRSMMKTKLTQKLGTTLANIALYILGNDLTNAFAAFTQGDEPNHNGAGIYWNIRKLTDDVQVSGKDKLLETLHSMMLDYNGTDTTDVTPDVTAVLQP